MWMDNRSNVFCDKTTYSCMINSLQQKNIFEMQFIIVKLEILDKNESCQ